MNEEPPIKDQQIETRVVAEQGNQAQIETKLVAEQGNQALPPNPQTATPQPVVPQPAAPARRLRELLAVPERERSDAVWDEIISLEIQLAPGNRAPSPQALANGGQQGGGQQQPGRNADQGQRRGQAPGGKSAKRFSNKSKRGPRRQVP